MKTWNKCTTHQSNRINSQNHRNVAEEAWIFGRKVAKMQFKCGLKRSILHPCSHFQYAHTGLRDIWHKVPVSGQFTRAALLFEERWKILLRSENSQLLVLWWRLRSSIGMRLRFVSISSSLIRTTRRLSESSREIEWLFIQQRVVLRVMDVGSHSRWDKQNSKNFSRFNFECF